MEGSLGKALPILEASLDKAIFLSIVLNFVPELLLLASLKSLFRVLSPPLSTTVVFERDWLAKTRSLCSHEVEEEPFSEEAGHSIITAAKKKRKRSFDRFIMIGCGEEEGILRPKPNGYRYGTVRIRTCLLFVTLSLSLAWIPFQIILKNDQSL